MTTLPKNTCSVDNCDRPPKAHEMCDMHYKQWWRANRTPKPCAVDGCKRPHMARGYCDHHYNRLRRYGDPLGVSPSNKPAVDLPGETWRPIPGWPEYLVSDHGRVKRAVTDSKNHYVAGRLVRPRLSSDGYPRVTLSRDGKMRGISAHVLVALAFISPQPVGHQVNHKNGIKTDNRPENLEWVTAQENVRHRFRVLKQQPLRGMQHGMAKLTRAEVIEMRAKRAAGATLVELAEAYGVSAPHVHSIVERKLWKHI